MRGTAPGVEETPHVFKDSRTRSLLKGVTWRFVATATTVAIVRRPVAGLENQFPKSPKFKFPPSLGFLEVQINILFGPENM